MKKQLFIIILTIACTALSAAAQTKERAAIEETEARFSSFFAKGDTLAVSNLYDEDAAIFPPNGARLEGRANIRNFWQGAFEAGVKKVETRTVEVSGSGNLLYEVGGYTLFGDENRILDEGKYIVVWKKEGRNFVMLRDVWNSNRK